VTDTKSDELSRRQRLLVFAICCVAVMVVMMDISIVNVALPTIRRDLDTTISGLQWTIDAYTLVLASFVVLAGSTADRVGRRRIFMVGLAVFGIASLLCGRRPRSPSSGGAVPHYRRLNPRLKKPMLSMGVQVPPDTSALGRFRSSRIRR
jgi:sugar phosphate permease